MIESVSSQLHARINALVVNSGARVPQPNTSKSANVDRASLASSLEAVGYDLQEIASSSTVAGAAKADLINKLIDTNFRSSIPPVDAGLNEMSAKLKAQETMAKLATQPFGITSGSQQNMLHLIDRLA